MRVFFCLLFMLLLPASVFATTPYFSLKLGGNYVQDAKTADGYLIYNPGFSLLGAAGYKLLSDRLRTEAELSYNNNTIKHAVVRATKTKASGRTDTWAVMGNAIYTFPVSEDHEFFVGAGAGLARVEIIPKKGNRSDAWVPAYQGMIGWAKRISTYDFFEIHYRYLLTSDPKFDGYNSEYNAHGLFIGFRMEL